MMFNSLPQASLNINDQAVATPSFTLEHRSQTTRCGCWLQQGCHMWRWWRAQPSRCCAPRRCCAPQYVSAAEQEGCDRKGRLHYGTGHAPVWMYDCQ